MTMSGRISRTISYLNHLPAQNIKRTATFLFFFLLLLLISLRTFDHSILVWAVVTGFITYLADTECSIGKHLISPARLRKVSLLLLLVTVFFALTDVDWKSGEWLKSYIDSGTLLFVLFFIITYFMEITSKRLYLLTTLFALGLIPFFVTTKLPVLADTYAVFAFLLVFRLIFREIRGVRSFT